MSFELEQPTHEEDVIAFHNKYEIPMSATPTTLEESVSKFRIGFLEEELTEYKKAVGECDLEGQLDALVDLVYVAVGTAVLQGFPFQAAWNRVHEANMKKVRVSKPNDGRHKFDVVKPAGWRPPDLRDLVHPLGQLPLFPKEPVIKCRDCNDTGRYDDPSHGSSRACGCGK